MNYINQLLISSILFIFESNHRVIRNFQNQENSIILKHISIFITSFFVIILVNLYNKKTSLILAQNNRHTFQIGITQEFGMCLFFDTILEPLLKLYPDQVIQTLLITYLILCAVFIQSLEGNVVIINVFSLYIAIYL